MTLESKILEGLVPGVEETRQVMATRRGLEDAATEALSKMGLDGVAKVQGSIAKDTWISGDMDLDCFLILAPETPEESFESIVSKVAEDVLKSPRKKYAQHPYIIGKRDGLQVDLVPSYRIETADQRLSAVDRTPLHTEWVRTHLDTEARNQVRLAKQWCKGVGIYGAETRIGGLSGYLVEVLVHQFSNFRGFIQWAASGAKPRRIAFESDDVNDDVSPLVVVDPVDATRNCAAAVTSDALELLEEAATTYLTQPDSKYFRPEPPRRESESVLSSHLAQEGVHWFGLVLKPETDRLDLVFPQFQRASRVASDALERAGFPVRRVRVDAWDDDKTVGLQWITDAVELPPKRIHRGPPASQVPNADKFRSKWSTHPDVSGEILVGDDGRLEVELDVLARTSEAWMQTNLSLALTGKHVQRALAKGGAIITDTGSVPDSWAPIVADHVLDRRPWQRQSLD
jgi:tRNA nucleotidyltransferase (CCA-adding enzyme)